MGVGSRKFKMAPSGRNVKMRFQNKIVMLIFFKAKIKTQTGDNHSRKGRGVRSSRYKWHLDLPVHLYVHVIHKTLLTNNL